MSNQKTMCLLTVLHACNGPYSGTTLTHTMVLQITEQHDSNKTQNKQTTQQQYYQRMLQNWERAGNSREAFLSTFIQDKVASDPTSESNDQEYANI